MTETKISNCLLLTIIILTAAMFVWTINIISNANQLKNPAAISAFSG